MTNNKLLTWILVAGIIFVLGGMTFVAGFGAGFGTGRLTYPQQLASLEAGSLQLATAGSETPRAQATVNGGAVPEEFDLLWEAWDALEEDYFGELPETADMAGGMVAGILEAAERETDKPLDREETIDALMAAVVATIQDQYGTVPAPSELTYGAIDGVIFLLDDDFTSLLSPEDASFFTEGLSGSFEGIGARVDSAPDGGVLIVEPFEGQPAWVAGIRRDDVILAVDGTDVTDMSLSDAIKLIRGPKGTKVLLLVQSPDQDPREIEVVRDQIQIPVVEYELLDENVAYLRLGEFSTPSTKQLREALDEMLAEEPVGLILDLRGNPGGFLHTAVDISSEFVPDGPILIERFKDGEEQVYEAKGNGRATEIPLVVLVDEASASASEILAGAVQDSGRGILVGTTTFGKGSVQVPHDLSDGSLLRVTTARWFTPDNREIHGEGLQPDIEVERSLDDRAAGIDPQLQRAIEYLLNLGQ